MKKSRFSDSQIIAALNLLVESIMAFRKIKFKRKHLFTDKFLVISAPIYYDQGRRFAVGGESTRFEDMVCRRQMNAGQEYRLNSGQGLEANVIGYAVGKCIAALSAGIPFVR